MFSSRRASGAPRQWWVPNPKARCWRTLARSRSKSAGHSNRDSSRLADPQRMLRIDPAGIVHAAELDVDRGRAEQPLHRALQAQHLLGQQRHVAIRIGRHLGPRLGVGGEQPGALGQRVGRRLGPADERVRHHLGVQLVVVQRPAPLRDLGVDEVRQQRVVGLTAQPLEDRLEVVLGLDLLLRRPDHLLLGLHHPEALHPGVGPRLDLPDVLLPRAHLLADHDQRQRHGELADPLADAPVPMNSSIRRWARSVM